MKQGEKSRELKAESLGLPSSEACRYGFTELRRTFSANWAIALHANILFRPVVTTTTTTKIYKNRWGKN